MNDAASTAKTAILLSNGKCSWRAAHAQIRGDDEAVLDVAELYDPDTGTWTAIANTQAQVASSTEAFLQPDGKVHARVFRANRGPGRTVRPGDRGLDRHRGAAQILLPKRQPSGQDGTMLLAGLYPNGESEDADVRPLRCTTRAAGPRRPPRAWSGGRRRLFTLLRDGTVLAEGGSQCNSEGECIPTGVAELYVPAACPCRRCSFASPPPLVFPSPSPRRTPLPRRGPVPPNARSWKVTVDDESSEPATLFVVGDGRERITARRFDSERGPGRRDREGDLPLP